MSGEKDTSFEQFDRIVTSHMDLVGCQAATIAVSRHGKLLYSRGYGWKDDKKKKPTLPDSLMRIASVTKFITAIAVKQAIKDKALSLDTKAFELIGLKPRGNAKVDPRIHQITVGQLLTHRAGWDRDVTSFDPMFHAKKIESALGLKRTATPTDVVQYMLTQPLQFDPGEKYCYSNFGFCVLGRVIEKVRKKAFYACIQEDVLTPLEIKDIKPGHTRLAKRDAREVSYPVREDAIQIEMMDAHGGMIASAPALCRILDIYWINGDLRKSGDHGAWTFFGSLPGTTAMVRQIGDGFNIAVLLNGRREKEMNEDHEQLKSHVDEAVRTLDLAK